MPNDSTAVKPIPFPRSLSALIIAGMMIAAALCAIPSALAEGSNDAAVPEPSIGLSHKFGQSIDDRTTGNEVWTLDVTEGDVTLLFMARNLTTLGTDGYWIDYQFNINYHSGGSIYIAQITTMNTVFVVGDNRISSPLDSCDHMEMTYTPVVYDAGVPSLYCNITFAGINVYGDGSIASTYDLTLSHHITVGLNKTDVKVEAMFDLEDTKLVDPSTGSEYAQGTGYAIELPYSMMLTFPNSHGEPIPPTGHSDTSLEYDLTDASGNPLRVSQLKMNNEFSILNDTGSHGAMGYSRMQYEARSMVTHGFPGLVYGETNMVRSDPEITVYYDAIGNPVVQGLSGMLIYIVIGAVAVAGVAAVVVLRKKKR